MGNSSSRIRKAQSAYLRQHADNPVDWWPWGAEAFDEARRRNVPVFLSIGYAACHWCHVMARESFEDEGVAQLLDDRFVAIKVDREEHPDVDEAYMAATQAMTGQGGWPMSVFTLPDGRVFHAGMYYPPRRKGQMPSFTEVLHAVDSAWTERHDQVVESATKIAEALGRQRRQQAQMATVVRSDDGGPAPSSTDSAQTSAPRSAQFSELLDQALSALVAEEDTVHGGFGAAPKFPPSPMLELLLEEAAWDSDSAAAGLAARTLETMGRSALFDQIEGGFARYATDRAWALPHFEKMLYDNSQLLGHYARLSVHPAADEHQRADAARIAGLCIDWLRHRMLLPSGLVASSLDADTVDAAGQHVEGGTYLFTDADLEEAARAAGFDGEQADQLLTLNQGVPAEDHAAEPAHLSRDTPRTVHFDAPLTAEERELWNHVLPELRRRRASRAQPDRDEKVVAAWNAQLVRSLAEAAALWDDVETLDFAESLAARLWEIHADDAGRVVRTSYEGVPGEITGTLSDHGQMALACFALASAGASTGEAEDSNGTAKDSDGAPSSRPPDNQALGGAWTQRGVRVLAFTLEHFVTTDGDGWSITEGLDEFGLLTAAQGGPAHASGFDGPEPAGLAVLAHALQRAEALEMTGELPAPGAAQASDADPAGDGPAGSPQAAEPLRAGDLLHHLPLAAPKAPLLVGASLQAAARSARKSPALRLVSGAGQDVAAVRRAGAVYGIPVEPVAGDVVADDARLQLSVCLNSPEAMVCLPPVGSIEAALEKIR